MIEIPQLITDKKRGEYLNGIHIFSAPTNTPFGNLQRKPLWIISRLEQLNLKIHEIYKYHEVVINNLAIIDYEASNKLDELIEEFVYSLRRLVDEFIALNSYVEERLNKGKYSERVILQELGNVFRPGADKIETVAFLVQKGLIPFLEKLNNISNSYKHSFSQTDVGLFRVDVPGYRLIHYHHNSSKNTFLDNEFSRPELVNSANIFLSTFSLVVKANCKKAFEEDQKDKNTQN